MWEKMYLLNANEKTTSIWLGWGPCDNVIGSGGPRKDCAEYVSYCGMKTKCAQVLKENRHQLPSLTKKLSVSN